MPQHNNHIFMTKELRKEIKTRSKLKNKFSNNQNYENWCSYEFQKILWVNLLRKTKKQHWSNLNIRNIADNKTSWKITLVENDRIISDSKEITKVMNQFFINITKKLNWIQNPAKCRESFTSDWISTIINIKKIPILPKFLIMVTLILQRFL